MNKAARKQIDDYTAALSSIADNLSINDANNSNAVAPIDR